MQEEKQFQSNTDIDESLTFLNYQDVATQVPSQVLYEEVTADSTNDTGFTFNFRSPSDNALLDNDIIIEYSVTITKTGWGTFVSQLGGVDYIPAVSQDEVNAAFRQCYPVARAIQNLNVTINGSNFNTQPMYWIDTLNRLYFSEEEARTICSTSGGEFDGKWPGAVGLNRLLVSSTASGQADATNLIMNLSGVRQTANTVAPNIPLANDDFYNGGLDKRWNRMVNRIHEKYSNSGTKSILVNANGIIVPINAAGIPADSVTLTLFERLPIAPFVFHPSKDPKMSIPNIKQISINGQFISSNLHKHILQGEADGQLIANGVRDAPQSAMSLSFNNVKAKLHVRWRLSEMSIPPVIKIPAPKYQQYVEIVQVAGVAGAAGPATLSSQQFSNIQLDAVPDKFFIFLKRSESDYEMTYPSEFNLSIKNLTLTIGGSSGRLTSYNSVQMYNSWLKHSAHGGEGKLSYEEWYKYRCVAVLEPADIGLVAGPGFNYKTSMTVKVDLESYWDIPGVYNRRNAPYLGGDAQNFDFVVLCCYNRHYIELNSSGGSRSGMTLVPRM